MTNAITNYATVQARIAANATGTRRDLVAASMLRSHCADLRPGKRLPGTHLGVPFAAACAAGPSRPAAVVSLVPGCRSVDAVQTPVAGSLDASRASQSVDMASETLPSRGGRWQLAPASELDLPAALWATCVIARAVSA